jgi:hypothetical protein
MRPEANTTDDIAIFGHGERLVPAVENKSRNIFFGLWTQHEKVKVKGIAFLIQTGVEGLPFLVAVG